ncbi:MAG: hypothetical protein ORN53_01575 [Crocinitomicaceae bacterium]|jgi:hypothetical protein|nr:hypothetical protein [Crocinitomicaceae bacterium]
MNFEKSSLTKIFCTFKKYYLSKKRLKMKKTMILGAFASLMMVSCAKDYSCKCVTTETISGVNNSQTTVINGKKKDAQAACEAQTVTVGTVVKTCGLE